MERFLPPETPTPQEAARDEVDTILAHKAFFSAELVQEARELNDLYEKGGPDAVPETGAINLIAGKLFEEAA